MTPQEQVEAIASAVLSNLLQKFEQLKTGDWTRLAVLKELDRQVLAEIDKLDYVAMQQERNTDATNT